MDVFAKPATHAQAARAVIDCSGGKGHQSASMSILNTHHMFFIHRQTTPRKPQNLQRQHGQHENYSESRKKTPMSG
jgi:hypothetical protein